MQSQQSDVAFEQQMREIVVTGSYKPFKPWANYIPDARLVMVVIKDDCPITSDRISKWSEIHWEDRPLRSLLWKKCVGFSIDCLPPLSFSEDVSVTEFLDSVLLLDPSAFGKYKKLFYRLGRGLIVHQN